MWPFKRKPTEPALLLKPREGATLYAVGGGWGDRISWFGDELKRVSGHKQIIPREGDVLTCEMQSGKTGVWIFQKIDHCYDPPDMFFADVNGIGYAGEVGFELPAPPKSWFQLAAAQ